MVAGGKGKNVEQAINYGLAVNVQTAAAVTTVAAALNSAAAAVTVVVAGAVFI